MKPPKIFLLLALAVSLAFTGSSLAQNSFTYDFENLTVGNDLVGQDGWTQVATWFSPVISNGTGVDTSKTASRLSPAQGNGTGAQRSLGSTFTYTPADTNVEWQFDGIGAGGGATQLSLLGITFGEQSNAAYLRLANSQELLGDALTSSDWYQLRLSLNFSVPGVSASLAYRDLTANSLTFTQDSVLQNINLGLTPNGQGNYQTSSIQIRMDTDTGGTYLDNINLQGVPEPSTYAMGVLGGIGLLLHFRRRHFRRNRE